ncbi:MAG: hypothetical protein IJU81_08485 [Bacteroidales bacterium]|nr:hypothetical protein [Bacteroidales bacterium]
MAVVILSLASCRHYDDFEIAGTVVEQEFCTNLQNRGYVVALSSPEGVGGSYVCDDGSRYDNVVVVYNADRIIKKNAKITGRVYFDNNHSKAECTYHYDRDCPEAVFTKLKIVED